MLIDSINFYGEYINIVNQEDGFIVVYALKQKNNFVTRGGKVKTHITMRG